MENYYRYPKKEKRISRRDFLKKSIIATLGILLGIKTIKNEKEIFELQQEIEKINKQLEEIINSAKKNPEKLTKLKVRATAYTSGPESTGKKPGTKGYGITYSGLRALKGAVAVDPNVIPLGSVLEIPGYGYGIAIDTGSAIKGNKIDVYFDKKNEAIKWGNKEIEIRILGKIESF
jgi:3D (Asp-Asp-Asp) domain-containing protein